MFVGCSLSLSSSGDIVCECQTYVCGQWKRRNKWSYIGSQCEAASHAQSTMVCTIVYLILWSSALHSGPVSEVFKEVCFEMSHLRILAMNSDPKLCLLMFEQLAEVDGKTSHVDWKFSRRDSVPSKQNVILHKCGIIKIMVCIYFSPTNA